MRAFKLQSHLLPLQCPSGDESVAIKADDAGDGAILVINSGLDSCYLGEAASLCRVLPAIASS